MQFTRFLSNNSTTLYRIGFALAIALVISQFRFHYIEAMLYDGRVRLRPTPPVSGLVELIAIDPPTVEKLGHVPNAVDHLQFVERLKTAGATAVVYAVDPTELTGTSKEKAALGDALSDFKGFFVVTNDVALKGEQDVFKLAKPFDQVKVMSGPKTSDKVRAADDVTRNALISYEGMPTLHVELAKIYNPKVADEKNIRGLYNDIGSHKVFINFHPKKSYPTVSFFEVMQGKTDLSHYAGKVVFVGRDLQTSQSDYARTPYSRDLYVAMPVLELHANIFDTLVTNSAPIRAPRWLDLIVTALISTLVVYVVLNLKPTVGLVVLIGTILGYALTGFLLFWLGGIWIGMAQPFLAVFIAYYFFIPYRLIIENRRSWEYYQKNRLLTQVEELKTNFLSMMSHDLKTPIARIQGMTDLVLNDTNPLSSKQREALETLGKSAEELLDFVSSILNLGRIESKEIQLHLSSRDPNAVLRDVVNKLDYLAKKRNIEIVCELEPLFSIRMDADLIRQVLYNLVENAIKYSRENSRILITSEENEGRVIVQVADQGVGIAEDDLPHVFMKFYRSRAAKTSTVKGSGLGLYLAKYFVELHNGTISVDSRPGVGSTFTVEMPTGPQVEH